MNCLTATPTPGLTFGFNLILVSELFYKLPFSKLNRSMYLGLADFTDSSRAFFYK